MWKSEHQRLTPKYDVLYSFVLLAKHYFLTMEEDDSQSKITCQRCNGFVTCSGRSSELLYITFICDGFSALGIYPEELDPGIFYFQ